MVSKLVYFDDYVNYLVSAKDVLLDVNNANILNKILAGLDNVFSEFNFNTSYLTEYEQHKLLTEYNAIKKAYIKKIESLQSVENIK